MSLWNILTANTFPLTHRHVLRMLVAACLLASIPFLAGPAAMGQALTIPNSTFTTQESHRKPVPEWTFESIKMSVDPESKAASLQIKPKGEAMLLVPEDLKGVILEGTTDMARGDLVSAPLDMEPFLWVEVTVRYQVESGEPHPFVCLRPTKDRSKVDLEFLPSATPGQEAVATVKLHTGSSEKAYSIALSMLGKGQVRLLAVGAVLGDEYPRPERPAFVLDMLHVKPPPSGKLGWESAEKLVTVFGFPSVEYLHYSEVTREKLEAIDPGLIILSPKSEELDRSDVKRILDAVTTTVDHGAPVVGICLGHQVLAMARGGQLGMKVDENPDGSQRLLSEWGPTMIQIIKEDPLFEGLPRRPIFCASESHNAMVDNDTFTDAELLASTEICETQIYRYRGKPWYTFQCHIERGWEYNSPEAYLLWKNMLRHFFLAP